MSKQCEKFVVLQKQFGQSTLTAPTCCCWEFGFLHLLHTHQQIKRCLMFISDIWSKCFLVLTGWIRTNLLLHHSYSLCFSVSKILTDFGWLWESVQVDIFPCMSQSRIHVIIHTCSTNVYTREKNFYPLDDFIFAWCMKSLSWHSHPSLWFKRFKAKIWITRTFTCHGWKCSLQLPHVAHAVVTPC